MMPSRGLDDLQKNAANLVLAGWPLTRIANYLEVSRPTIYAWKKLPDWEQYIREQSGEAVDARVHRVRQITDLALEQIEGSLIDPEIAPARRAEIALRWVNMVMQNLGETSFKLAYEAPKQIDPMTIRRVISELYGVDDPEVQNADAKILEPGLDGTIVDESE